MPPRGGPAPETGTVSPNLHKGFRNSGPHYLHEETEAEGSPATCTKNPAELRKAQCRSPQPFSLPLLAFLPPHCDSEGSRLD